MNGDRFGRGAAAALLVAAGWMVLQTGPRDVGRGQRCAHPVTVEGQLLCELAEVTERLGACTDPVPAAGDRIDDLSERPCGAEPRGRPRRMAAADLRRLEVPVDLNRASEAELTSLRGVGRAIAGRIVSARPFEAPSDLERVRGIGPRTMERNRSRLRVSPRP